jgi:hypothetical protein
MTQSEKLQLIKAQQKALQAELIELKKGTPTLKMEKNKRVEIGEKGTINVYGLGRFPVCLYMSQLINLQNIINSQEFAEFILANTNKIAVKTEV